MTEEISKELVSTRRGDDSKGKIRQELAWGIEEVMPTAHKETKEEPFPIRHSSSILSSYLFLLS